MNDIDLDSHIWDGDAYKNYCKTPIDSISFLERSKYFKVNGLEFNSGYPNYIHYTKEEFINKIKNDDVFAKKWGTVTKNNSMETKELVELMLKSSDHNPYTGDLSREDNIIAATALAKLCKEFADKGQTNEAMNVPSEQWIEVIEELNKLK